MAPDCIKDLDIEEINSMLLEELLGISNKRLKYIFNGQNLDEDSSSSTDPEEEKEPIDIISLDDVSEDDFVIETSLDKPRKHKKHSKVKEEPSEKKIKKEKHDKVEKNGNKQKEGKEKSQEENLMSVLELLELQARARAIRSQLVLEASKKTKELVEQELKQDDSDTDDPVIIESPKNDEIVITSSDSESEKQVTTKEDSVVEKIMLDDSEISNISDKKNKIKLIRNRFSQADASGDSNVNKELEANSPQSTSGNSKDLESINETTKENDIEIIDKEDVASINKDEPLSVSKKEHSEEVSRNKADEVLFIETIKLDVESNNFDNDEIVINVDEAEMDGIIGN